MSPRNEGPRPPRPPATPAPPPGDRLRALGDAVVSRIRGEVDDLGARLKLELMSEIDRRLSAEIPPGVTLDDPVWLIYSREHRAWWNPAERGYTRDPSLAGRYTYGRALAICRGANEFLPAEGGPNEFLHLAPEGLARLGLEPTIGYDPPTSDEGRRR